MPITFKTADAEDLPFDDNSFDAVLSTFGVMFTASQETAAQELKRVCRVGGRIGLANWTPDGFIGQLFKTIGKHVPPAAGLKSSALWGTEEHLITLFPDCEIRLSKQIFNFRYRSAAHWLDVFKTFYGPTNRAFAALDAGKQAALEIDIVQLLDKMRWPDKETLVVPSEYIQAVITKL